MLIRRIEAQCKRKIICIGTSATMVSGGTAEDRRGRVAEVASTLFGKPFDPSQVVGETLAPSLDASAGPPTKQKLAASIAAGISPSDDLAALRVHPAARKEFLKRLLAENHRRTAAESAAAPRAKPMSTNRRKRSNKQAPDLF